MNRPEDAGARAEVVARAACGKLLAILASRTGDIMAAEDALSDAFVAALATWPGRGIPERPEAWLLSVARNRQIDRARKDRRLVITDVLPEAPDMGADPPPPPVFEDARLKLLFVCAHPAIDASVHTHLMLQTVLGLDAAQIARAYLVSPGAMAQRLVRAKRKIKSARIPFAIPEPDLFDGRLAAVLEAVYGAYAVDWLDGGGDLSHEAFYLSSLLAEHAPDNAEALALAALIGFIEARRGARIRDGALVPVPEQDAGLWDSRLIARSGRLLARAARLGTIGRFQLEAAMQSVHAARATTGRTDWQALAQLYSGVMRISPTIGAAVGHAAAVAEAAGPAEGLALLEAIAFPGAERFQPCHAVRADCLARLGRTAEAVEAYARAIALCTHPPSRRWLEGKAAALRQRSF